MNPALAITKTARFTVLCPSSHTPNSNTNTNAPPNLLPTKPKTSSISALRSFSSMSLSDSTPTPNKRPKIAPLTPLEPPTQPPENTTYTSTQIQDIAASMKSMVLNLPLPPPFSSPPLHTSIFLDINDPYVKNLYIQLFAARSNQGYDITVGPGLDGGDEPLTCPSNCTFILGEYERVDWAPVLSGRLFTSNYCVRKGLSRKAHLATYLRRFTSKNPESILNNGVPVSYVIETWDAFDDTSSSSSSSSSSITMADGRRAEFTGSMTMSTHDKLRVCAGEAMQAMVKADDDTDPLDPYGPTWILKPSSGNKGVGIHIVKVFEEVLDVLSNCDELREWVLQRYVDRPLLIAKRKFHIRAYVLAVNALEVYFYDEVLVLTSGTKYKRSDTSNYLAHITNTAYQAIDPNFKEEKCIMLLSDVAKILVKQNTCADAGDARGKVASILKQMHSLTSDLFAAYKGEFGVYAPLEGCFEHYGLDFLVDSDFTVFLLEVNPGPDFKQTGERLKTVVAGMLGETIDICLGGDRSRGADRVFSKVYETQMRGGEQGKVSMKLT